MVDFKAKLAPNKGDEDAQKALDALSTPNGPYVPPESLQADSAFAEATFKSSPISKAYDPYAKFIEPFDGVMVDEQLAAAERLVTDEKSNFFITGGAGTGKSYLVRALRSIIPISVCSTTGMSAVNVGGVTCDRQFGFSRETWSVRNESKLREIMNASAPTILIDECSQIGKNMAKVLYDVAIQYRKRLILVGDHAQAAPVLDEAAIGHPLFKTAKRIKLMHCHRQSDAVYLGALNKVRLGETDDEVRRVFRQCVDRNHTTPATDDFVRLYATNATTLDYNRQRFNKLPQTFPITTLNAEFIDLRKSTMYPTTAKEIEKAYENSRVAHNLLMTIGARVMIMANQPGTDYPSFVNGDCGIVVDMITYDGKSVRDDLSTEDRISGTTIEYIVVLLDRNGQEMFVPKINRDINDAFRKPLHRVVGFPIALGWAMTIHKAQGSTMQKALLNMESIEAFPGKSRHGIAYVGLSRTTSLEGLRIDKWVEGAVYSDPVVKDYL